MFLLIIALSGANVAAVSEPYDNYVYNSNFVAQIEPQAYIPSRIITGESLGIGSFSGPEGVFVAPDGRIYIVDTRNNRIIVLSDDFSVERVIDSFNDRETVGSFNQPRDIFVTAENILYVADTENSRIVVMRQDDSLVKILEKPEIALFQGEYRYQPVSVVVDSADRVFVVSLNVSEGIIEYDANGEFLSFFGSIRVKRDLSQVFWRAIGEYIPRIKDQLRRNIPTEYSSIALDEKDFIFATTSIVSERDEMIFVRRLNPLGIDVLKRNDIVPPNGDMPSVRWNPSTGRAELVLSNLVDVVTLEDGIYSVLDRNKGRVFTYTSNGELMYVFGSNGTRSGQFGRVAALEVINNEDYLVVDSQYNQIVLFTPTEYGRIIKEAVSKYNQREYELAGIAWEKAIPFTAKSRLIYNGYGRYLLQQGEYEEAMRYFKHARNDVFYSDAYEYFRKQIIDDNFNIISITLILLIASILIFRKVRKSKVKKHG